MAIRKLSEELQAAVEAAAAALANLVPTFSSVRARHVTCRLNAAPAVSCLCTAKAWSPAGFRKGLYWGVTGEIKAETHVVQSATLRADCYKDLFSAELFPSSHNLYRFGPDRVKHIPGL